MNPLPLSRRAFFQRATLASAATVAFPHLGRSQAGGGGSANEKLNVALVGVGGQGRAAVNALNGENFVAFCDVDDVRAAPTYSE
ncbi:MAG TPA: hypothetical protein VHF69_12645, partial [Candidatus Synoicihabitans sp.]|nr:hypothetical protein [Candidatus Synoicihabitans sp.]